MPDDKINIKSYTHDDLQRVLTKLGEPKYRADQIYRWLFNDRVADFESMSNLGSNLRKKLSTGFFIPSCSIQKMQHEPATGCGRETTKLLVRLHDGQTVETVLIPADERNTVCVSSQVGCALGCTFCATGYMGFTRNLNAAEIIEQVYLVNDLIAVQNSSNRVTNIVFMGMGEPLLNLSNVLEAVKTLSDQSNSFALSQRRITISTVGLSRGITEIAQSGLKSKLAVSLHSANQAERASLIPVAKEHTLEKLRNTLEKYVELTHEPVTLVYMLVEGVNDRDEDAKNLARFGRRFLCKINLIDYNSIVNMEFKPVKAERRDRFKQILVDAGLLVTVRKSYGTSINAACGQLALADKKAEPSGRTN